MTRIYGRVHFAENVRMMGDKADERPLNREAAESFEDYFELVLIRRNWSRTPDRKRMAGENSF